MVTRLSNLRLDNSLVVFFLNIMHPLLEVCYLKLYLYCLRCYGYLLVIYLHVLMAYVPILRTFVCTKAYVLRIFRDCTFHARLELKHWHREWKQFRRRVLRPLRDSILAVASVSKLKIPEPPASHLLLSNYPPNDTEIKLVRKAIQQAKDERLRIKAHMLVTTAANRRDLVWETLTSHKISLLSTFINQHEGIVSSLRLLPPEILQYIFHFAAPTCTHIPRTWFTPGDMPWAFGQVCRSWRKSALHYSPLWSSLPRLELRTTKSRTTMQLEMVEELLKRSGAVPLDIYVNALPESYHLHSHPTLDLLKATSERWVVAAFALPVHLSRSIEVIKGRLPLLEKLFVHDHIALGVESVEFDMFKIAPKLWFVNTSAIHHLGLPIDQLVSCKVEISASSFLLQILSSPKPCPMENLTILEVLDPQSVMPVTLPRLVKLSARFWASHDTAILKKLTLPAIEHIQILCCESNVLLQNLIVMLSNCGNQESTLKRLWYRIPDPNEEGLSDLLALVPNLIELDANFPEPETIGNLVNRYKGQNLVPLLKSCRFYVKNDQLATDVANEFNDLAESRCEILGTVGGEDSSGFIFPDEVRPLESLLLYSDDQNAVHSFNGYVNGYTTSGTYLELTVAGAELSKAAELLKKNGSRRRDELEIVLDFIERIEVHDVGDIYFSGLHLYLRQVRSWKKQGLEKYARHAGRILEQWEPRFKTNWGTRKWAMKGPFCLVYVRRNDPLRTSSNRMEIAYEVNPRMPIPEVLWPRTTLRDFC